MKKSKVILAIILAVVLIVICISAPTFSWFTRLSLAEMESKGFVGKGEKMELNTKNQYPVYNGYNVSLATATSADGTNNSYTTAVTGSGTGANGFSGSGINSFNKKYFCTTITNSSGYDQNVSLYISKLSIPTSNQAKLALGVNEPTRSYHDYTSLVRQVFTATNNTMRIYFEKDNSVSGWNGTEFYICWNEDTNTGVESLNPTGSNGTYTKMLWVGGNNPNHYYADIPRTATHAFFCVENWGTNNNGNANWGQRSQTLWNLAADGEAWNAPMLYKITSSYKDGNSNSNHLVVKYNSPGVGINQYYSSISVAANNTFDASFTSGQVIGGTKKYYSGDTSVFTVDENTGEITGVASGEATLYSKVINDNNGYGDAMQVETNVKVTAAGYYEFNDVPIVKNLLIPGAAGNDQNNPANVVKVYWYILNNSSSSLSYIINNVYLGP